MDPSINMFHYTYILINKQDLTNQTRYISLSSDHNIEESIYVDIYEHDHLDNFRLMDIQTIKSLYLVKDVQQVKEGDMEIKCIGCLNDCPAQKDHMEYPTGCLSDF